MRKQPDFHKLYMDSFGGRPRKITYAVRKGNNRYHDVEFLYGLLHDASFRPKDFRLKGTHLTIRMYRLAWALYLEDSAVLPSAKAQLDVSPVLAVRWWYRKGFIGKRAKALVIGGLWLDPRASAKDTLSFTFFDYARNWRCTLILPEDEFVMKLTDLEVPH